MLPWRERHEASDYDARDPGLEARVAAKQVKVLERLAKRGLYGIFRVLLRAKDSIRALERSLVLLREQIVERSPARGRSFVCSSVFDACFNLRVGAGNRKQCTAQEGAACVRRPRYCM